MSLVSVIIQIKHLARGVKRRFNMNDIPLPKLFLWAIQGELLYSVHSIMDGDYSMSPMIPPTNRDLVGSKVGISGEQGGETG